MTRVKNTPYDVHDWNSPKSQNLILCISWANEYLSLPGVGGVSFYVKRFAEEGQSWADKDSYISIGYKGPYRKQFIPKSVSFYQKIHDMITTIMTILSLRS